MPDPLRLLAILAHPDDEPLGTGGTLARYPAEGVDADPAYLPAAGAAHRVAKFYYKVWTIAEQALYESLFGPIQMEIDGVLRGTVGWPAWEVTTRIDCAAYWRSAWDAARCHATQIGGYGD